MYNCNLLYLVIRPKVLAAFHYSRRVLGVCRRRRYCRTAQKRTADPTSTSHSVAQGKDLHYVRTIPIALFSASQIKTYELALMDWGKRKTLVGS